MENLLSEIVSYSSSPKRARDVSQTWRSYIDINDRLIKEGIQRRYPGSTFNASIRAAFNANDIDTIRKILTEYSGRISIDWNFLLNRSPSRDMTSLIIDNAPYLSKFAILRAQDRFNINGYVEKEAERILSIIDEESEFKKEISHILKHGYTNTLEAILDELAVTGGNAWDDIYCMISEDRYERQIIHPNILHWVTLQGLSEIYGIPGIILSDDYDQYLTMKDQILHSKNILREAYGRILLDIIMDDNTVLRELQDCNTSIDTLDLILQNNTNKEIRRRTLYCILLGINPDVALYYITKDDIIPILAMTPLDEIRKVASRIGNTGIRFNQQWIIDIFNEDESTIYPSLWKKLLPSAIHMNNLSLVSHLINLYRDNITERMLLRMLDLFPSEKMRTLIEDRFPIEQSNRGEEY